MTLRISRARADRMAVQHSFGLGVADKLAAQARLLLRQPYEMRAAIAPGVAAVGRAHDPADLQHGVDFVRTSGMPRKTHHPAGKRHLGAFRQCRIRHALPALAGILAAIDRYRRAAREHPLSIGGIRQERPDLHAAVGKGGSPERRAAVSAAPHAIGGPRKDKARITRVDEDRERLQLGQDVLPSRVVRVAPENPGQATLLARVIATHPCKYIRLSHGFLLPRDGWGG